METMVERVEALTDKEKQTLRLLLVGHDAKSSARALGLSVHTVNERLRDARRKLAVSSSREAARLLLQAEGTAPESAGDKQIGGAAPAAAAQAEAAPDMVPRSSRRAAWAIGGCLMLFALAAALALSTPAGQPSGPAASAPPGSGAAADPVPAIETAAGQAARAFLQAVDAADWDASYAATGRSFRAVNTVAAWRDASEHARAPLGRMLARTLVDESDTPAPPYGYRTVRFRTDFAERLGVIETVALDREGGAWMVVGVTIE